MIMMIMKVQERKASELSNNTIIPMGNGIRKQDRIYCLTDHLELKVHQGQIEAAEVAWLWGKNNLTNICG
jgi:hypothetical protein